MRAPRKPATRTPSTAIPAAQRHRDDARGDHGRAATVAAQRPAREMRAASYLPRAHCWPKSARCAPAAMPANAAMLVANEPLVQLLRDRVAAEATLASLETRFAASHPTLIKQRQTLASINETLETQLTRVERETQASVRSWQRQVDDLSRSRRRRDLQQGRPGPRVRPRCLRCWPRRDVKRKVFETVLNRYQTQLAEHGFSDPTAVIVSRAMPPSHPSFPRTSLFLVVGFMVSVLGGIAAALLMQLLRPNSDQPQHARRRGRLAAAGGHPALPQRVTRTRRGEDPRSAVVHRDASARMRNAIFEQHSARDTRVCLFTSVVPEPGQDARRDVTGPRVGALRHAHVVPRNGSALPGGKPAGTRSEPSRGIAAVLEERAQLADVIQSDQSTGLDMLLRREECQSLARPHHRGRLLGAAGANCASGTTPSSSTARRWASCRMRSRSRWLPIRP